MSKLKLSELSFNGVEVLTREQLKKVLGGEVKPGDCGTVAKCNTGTTCQFTNGGSGTCAVYGLNTPTATCGCTGVQ